MKKTKNTFKKFVHLPFVFIKKRWPILLILAVSVAGLSYWRYNKYQKENQPLTFEKPEFRDLTKTLEVSGVVDAKNKAQLRFIAGGKVVYLGAEEGDWVNKWQTIATIDRASLKKQLEQDLNAFEREFNEWDQHLDDTNDEYWKKRIVRQTENNQTLLDDTVLSVEIRNIAIRDTSLYAPFEGILTKSPTSTTGVQLLSNDYFEIIDPNTLVFKGQVDEADISQVSIGQPAELELDAYEDEIFLTHVSYISFTSNQTSSGTVFLVDFPLENNLTKYRLGMNGDISIILNQKQNVLSIPFEATRERDGKVFVDVKVDDTTFEERRITTGLETEEYIEVLEGLKADEEIYIPD